MKKNQLSKQLAGLVVLTVLSVGTLTGCNNYEINQWYNNESKIAKDTDRYAIDTSNRSAENGIYKGETTLTGTLTVWEYTAEADETLEVPYNFTVSKGNVKLVHISEDRTVTTILEKTEKGSDIAPKGTINIPLKKGLNRLKLVGQHAATHSIELNIQKGEFRLN